MMNRSAGKLVASALAVVLAANPAFADRDPTPEERSQVEEALQDLGFTSWDGIEFDDDGYWEVDDAQGPDGEEYDLHLAPDTFEELEREAD